VEKGGSYQLSFFGRVGDLGVKREEENIEKEREQKNQKREGKI
jgi:hypothetical protein